MNSCERFFELLSDYAENSLAPVEKREIDVHLKQCSECRSAAEGVANLRRNLGQLSAIQASPDFETILRTRIKLNRRANLAPLWDMRYAGPRRLATYSAAAVVAAVSVFYLGQRLSAKAIPPSSVITVSQAQPAPAPNQVMSSVSPAKILYTLDKVTPQLQLWPNLGATHKARDRSAPPPTDSLRTNPTTRPEVRPVSHQTITF